MTVTSTTATDPSGTEAEGGGAGSGSNSSSSVTFAENLPPPPPASSSSVVRPSAVNHSALAAHSTVRTQESSGPEVGETPLTANAALPREYHPHRRPKDHSFRQQRMRSWQPILDPVWVICALIVLGVAFVPVGVKIRNDSDDLLEETVLYDSYLASDGVFSCGINDTANANKTCTISMTIPNDVDPPIFVHYELDGFYQNQRRYVKSRDDAQLLGSTTQTELAIDRCKPLHQLGSVTLNPCGLIANTLFNDVITLASGEASDNSGPLLMVEDGIAWASDLDYKFKQPDGFQYGLCPNDGQNCTAACCADSSRTCYTETGLPYFDPKTEKCYWFYYPNEATTQYLYETYPMVVSPLEGVTNEHFVVWMRTAALPRFRKLYGYIDQPISAGTTLTFDIVANFEVSSWEGKKSLIVSTSNLFGARNDWLGRFFFIVGLVCLSVGVLFGVKHFFRPRRIADPQHLKYKAD